MEVHTRVYDAYAQAERAVRELEAAGIPSQDISIVANQSVRDVNPDADAPSATATGAGMGAAVGGGAGLLAGLGILALPGLGPVVAAGWLAATALGAAAGTAAGGVIGALIDSGTSEADAHVYSEAVRRGGTLLTVRSDVSGDRIRAVLDRHDPIDPAVRRGEYEAAGWQSYDPKAPDYKPNQTEIERDRRRQG